MLPMTDQYDLREMLEGIDVLKDDKPATYAGLLRIAERILDMAVKEEGRELTIWEKANIRLAIGAIAHGHLPMAWGDLNEALADPADIAPNIVSANEAAQLEEIKTETFRRDVRHLQGLTLPHGDAHPTLLAHPHVPVLVPFGSERIGTE